MKKNILLLCLIFIKSLSYSQFAAFTPKIGITLSNCKDFGETKYNPGYVLGASLLYKLGPKFAIKPELLIEQKGFRSMIIYTDENGWAIGTANTAVTWSYLVLPVQVRYSFFKNNILFISAGSYAGYMLWATDRLIKNGSSSANNSREKLDINQFLRFEIGLNAGVGINIPINGENKFEIEFRYERSFRDQNYRLPTATTTFSLSAGYTINLRK